MNIKLVALAMFCGIMRASDFCPIQRNLMEVQEKCVADFMTKQAYGANWDQANYEAWKSMKSKKWEEAKVTFIGQKCNDLIAIIKPSNTDFVSQLAANKDKFYAYNFLRELLGEPIQQCSIDEQWLSDVKKEAKRFSILNSGIWSRIQYSMPKVYQEELMQEAQIVTNLIDERVLLSGRSSSCTPESITIGQTADLDNMLSDIYHELGHINYGDVDLGESTQSFEKYQDGQTLENFALEHPKVNAQLDKMAQYVAQTKEKLDATSETGKQLIEEIKKTPVFWNSPQDPMLYIITAVGRARESRADLFAVEQLLRQKRLDPLLFKIHKWGLDYKDLFGRTVEDDAFDGHPSYFERALYIIGYLFSKGINVNTELKRWENFGTCTDVRKLYGPGSHLHKKEMNAVERACHTKEKKLSVLEYELFKAEVLKNLNATYGGSPANLFLDIETCLRFFQVDPDPEAEILQKQTLFAYNYLRELYNNPTAESVYQIDKSWIYDAHFDLFKKEKKNEWEKSNKTLPERINMLIDSIDYNLSSKNRKTAERRRDIIHSYNYLRELLNLPTVEVVGPQEEEWLKNLRFDLFKKEKIDEWEKGNKTLPERINELIWFINYYLSSKDRQIYEERRHIIHSYNYMRELLNLPIVQAIGSQDIAWFEQIKQQYK